MEAKAQDARRSNRTKVLLAATIKHGVSDVRVRVLDLSSHGALVVGVGLPPAEIEITLHCGKQSVAGWVAWVKNNHAGLSFNQRVSSEDFSPISVGTSHLVWDTAIRTNARRPGFRGDQLSAEERFFLNQLINDHHVIGAIPAARA